MGASIASVAVLVALVAGLPFGLGGAAVGIDLGTTFSCVAVVRNGRVEVIPNDQGNRVTPSWVAFTDRGRLVGEAAKNQVASNPNNTVYDVKRLLGRSFEFVRDREAPHLPFKVFDNLGRPVISVDLFGERQEFAPEEMSAAVLAHMKAVAETYLGEAVTEAVVTVPAYFNDAQRTATQAAAVIAGLNVRRMINEPTAAALAVGFGANDVFDGEPPRSSTGKRSHRARQTKGRGKTRGKRKAQRRTAGRTSGNARKARNSKGRKARNGKGRRAEADSGDDAERNLLVYDLGGGTFDVTLLSVSHGVFEVLATAGDTRLGGEDFDRAIVAHASELFALETGLELNLNSTAGGDTRVAQRLLREANRVKHALSSRLSDRLEVAEVLPGHDLSVPLTRAKFEEIVRRPLKRSLRLIKQVLDDAGVTKRAVHRVVLVGGSTRIPAVRRMLADAFGRRRVSAGVNPDEAVAVGAAVQAAILAGVPLPPLGGGEPDASSSSSSSSSESNQVVLLDVTPLSLGIETTGGLFSRIVERNTVVPTLRTKTYTTEMDNQPNIEVKVWKGRHGINFALTRTHRYSKASGT